MTEMTEILHRTKHPSNIIITQIFYLFLPIVENVANGNLL